MGPKSSLAPREEEAFGEKEVTQYLLDTHCWLWTLLGAEQEVSKNFFREVESWQQQRVLHLSSVSFWEVSLLAAAERIRLDTSVDHLLDTTVADDGWRIAPLTPRILIESTRLPGSLHRDPADRMLVATARELHLTLVTRDDKLLRYSKQGHLSARKP